MESNLMKRSALSSKNSQKYRKIQPYNKTITRILSWKIRSSALLGKNTLCEKSVSTLFFFPPHENESIKQREKKEYSSTESAFNRQYLREPPLTYRRRSDADVNCYNAECRLWKWQNNGWGNARVRVIEKQNFTPSAISEVSRSRLDWHVFVSPGTRGTNI